MSASGFRKNVDMSVANNYQANPDQKKHTVCNILETLKIKNELSPKIPIFRKILTSAD